MAGEIEVRRQAYPLRSEEGWPEFASGRARAGCLREAMSPSSSGSAPANPSRTEGAPCLGGRGGLKRIGAARGQEVVIVAIAGALIGIVVVALLVHFLP
jgi:hypothetical protein